MKKIRKRDKAKKILKNIFYTKTSHKKRVHEKIGPNKSIGEDIYNSTTKMFRYIKQNETFFKQSSFAHLISIFASIFAGIVLGKFEQTLLILPGLIVLVPAAIGMRGNIFSSLASRLGSEMHLGSINNFNIKNKILQQNIYSSLLISIIFSVILAFVARIILLSFGIESISIVSLIIISFIGGMMSGLILLFMTFFVAFVSYKKGLDPDNISSPIITALGDMVTIPSLIFAAIFITNYTNSIPFILIGIIIAFLYSIIKIIQTKKASYKEIIVQSAPILLVGIILDSIAGMILQSNMPNLSALPIFLLLIPGFLEQGGNIGNILASRLSTKLHLGTIKAEFKIDDEVKIEAINTYIFSFLLFPLLGIITFIVGNSLGFSGISFFVMLKTMLISGFLITSIVIAIAFFISIISFKLKLNPDNTTLPLIASATDLLGVIILMAVLHIFGVF